ncbi:YojF family protein [Calidifontibacillus erzurumensis]|uniref:YojF family protein n=1 Tax=Calidifontibacillus erzurumensis TaxID=2741433 RepID=A0A8J8KAT6_9BACI|nr:YojF family protein [Calidifontibacillus erzurumensis]NSL50947.1 YojF family protein [Calidifontibacillus erzurumensis]
MEPINPSAVQKKLDEFKGKDLYLHLETTNGAYASHKDQTVMTVGAYIRNGLIRYKHAKITGNGPYRIGMKMDYGWVYAEGLTHFTVDEKNRLLLAGHDSNGKLAVACQISTEPF